jgi:SAM-dependent methyltransferase
VNGSWSWERLERSNVGSQAALVELVDPQRDESVLDVGTGSGGLALLAARSGAAVTGIDIAEDGIARARARAEEEGLDVRFDVGDAQYLPYPDAAFDVVLSTFGVIFASDQRRAARELARVCKAAGRLGLTLMPSDSRSAEAVSIFREFGEGDGGDHPAAFADRLEELLSDAFAFEARRREVPAEPGGPTTWEEALGRYGELRTLASTLSPERLAALRRRVDDMLATWAGRPASYVIVVGHRREMLLER